MSQNLAVGALRLDHCSWLEVEAYLERSSGIIIPCGSTEQHGPMGLIGTDAICAEKIAEGAGKAAGALVAPTLAFTPAPFNTAFPGTISVSESVFSAFVTEIVRGLAAQGFRKIYFLNGHGANTAPLNNIKPGADLVGIRVRSWWDFAAVNELRDAYYGDWEGMHATPSEVAITQAAIRIVASDSAKTPPRKLSSAYIKAHAGDKHDPPELHRQTFPDGRVGSHSALARPEHGHALLKAAIDAVTADYAAFV